MWTRIIQLFFSGTSKDKRRPCPEVYDDFKPGQPTATYNYVPSMSCISHQAASFGVQYSQAADFENCCNGMLSVLGHIYQDNAVITSLPTSTGIESERQPKKRLAVLSHLVDWPRRIKLESIEDILKFFINLISLSTSSSQSLHGLHFPGLAKNPLHYSKYYSSELSFRNKTSDLVCLQKTHVIHENVKVFTHQLEIIAYEPQKTTDEPQTTANEPPTTTDNPQTTDESHTTDEPPTTTSEPQTAAEPQTTFTKEDNIGPTSHHGSATHQTTSHSAFVKLIDDVSVGKKIIVDVLKENPDLSSSLPKKSIPPVIPG